MSLSTIVRPPFRPEESLHGIDTLLGDDINWREEKFEYTLGELLTLDLPERYFLWGEYLPSSGLAAIVGPPDSGKSMLCRELALRIATGHRMCAGFDLRPKYGRAIYVSTEDGVEAARFCFRRQAVHIDPMAGSYEVNNDLRVVFTDDLDSAGLLTVLEQRLTEQPVDLIVLDSYSDLFDGKDSNSNTETRKFLKAYNRLANRFGCLILFIHHINKSGYADTPQQRHVQGASALSQKLRLILDFRPAAVGGKERYLTVVKGNWVSGKLKKAAVELEFSEESFTFERTGHEKPLTDFATEQKPRIPKPDSDYASVFDQSEPGLRYTELVNRIMNKFGYKVAQSKRIVTNNFIKGENGLYQNPTYQGITVSESIDIDTMIPDTSNTSVDIGEQEQGHSA